MYKLTARIQIFQEEGIEPDKKTGKPTDVEYWWDIDRVKSVTVTRDIGSLTDTCVIELPDRINWWHKNTIVESTVAKVAKGDKVAVWMGYNGNLHLVFKGYVSKVHKMGKIECEDEMYNIKTKSFAEVKSEDMAIPEATIEKIFTVAGITTNVKHATGHTIGEYRITSDNVGKMLNKLKDDYGFLTFIRYEGTYKCEDDGSLTDDTTAIMHTGIVFPKEAGHTHDFQFIAGQESGNNIIDDGKNLVYTADVDEVKFQVEVTSEYPDEEEKKEGVTVKAGLAGGTVKKVKFINKPEAELKKYAEELLKQYRKPGFTGNFKTFGFEFVDKLDVITLVAKDSLGDTRKEQYQVQKNVITYGSGGLRQEITLGRRVDI